MARPNNVMRVKCTQDSFYRAWVEFLTPFHKLTKREREVMARIIYQYFRLKESVDDPELLKDVMWSHTSRKDMRESLKMTQAHFQMALAKLKTAGVLIDGDIEPRYLPHKTEGSKFILNVVFDWTPAGAQQLEHAEG